MKSVVFFKPKYIRKYDYLRSFYQPKDQWFADLNSLHEFVHDKLINAIAKNNNKFIDFDEEDDEIYIDNVEYTKTLDLTKQEIQQKGLDQNDPKVREGLEIDRLSKEFILSKFPNYQVIDFDQFATNNELKAKQTLEVLKQNNNCILFQPVFIFNGVINKPDAIIKKDHEIILIEVKGTTNPKLYHLFDLYFQTQIINAVLDELDLTISKHYLCLVKYELKNFKELSFVLVDKVSFAKAGFNLPKQEKGNISYFSKEYINEIAQIKEGANYSEKRTITNILDEINQDEPDLDQNKRDSEKIEYLKSEFNNHAFWDRIDKLKNTTVQETNSVSLIPSLDFKSKIKDNDIWLTLKDYYYFSLEYLPLNFSANFVKFPTGVEIYQKYQPKNIDDLFLIFKSNQNYLTYRGLKYFNYLTNNQANSIVNYQNIVAFDLNGVNELLNKIKPKKVYFDFESLNLATRTMDFIPPFMQTVNQVSVVIEDENNHLTTKPYVVIDPINGIGKKDLKLIIDTILPSTNLEEAKQYSYIVYNINFERTCLKKMKAYLKDAEYAKKIDVIVNNLFDLADFFDIKKDKKHFFVFKELFGYYSIKKVLPLVQKYDCESYQQSGCKDYKLELDQVHNGVDAQKYSTLRFFGLINNQEWKKAAHNLGLYCDNDVLAMVAIERFVRKLVKHEVL